MLFRVYWSVRIILGVQHVDHFPGGLDGLVLHSTLVEL